MEAQSTKRSKFSPGLDLAISSAWLATTAGDCHNIFPPKGFHQSFPPTIFHQKSFHPSEFRTLLIFQLNFRQNSDWIQIFFKKKPLPHINKCFSCFCTQSSFISQSSTQLFKLLWGPSRRRGWDRNIFAFQIYFVSALKNAFSWRNVFSGKNERPSVFCRSCYSSLHGHRSRFFLIQLSDVFNPTVGKV